MSRVSFASVQRLTAKKEDTHSCRIGRESLCCGVFDGHGGRKAAEAAAEQLVPALLEVGAPFSAREIEDRFWLLDNMLGETGVPDGTTATVLLCAAGGEITTSTADECTHRTADGESSCGSGSGIARTVSYHGAIVCALAHVGDSTAIRVDMRKGGRRSRGGALIAATADHAPSNPDEEARLMRLWGVRRALSCLSDGTLWRRTSASAPSSTRLSRSSQRPRTLARPPSMSSPPSPSLLGDSYRLAKSECSSPSPRMTPRPTGSQDPAFAATPVACSAAAAAPAAVAAAAAASCAPLATATAAASSPRATPSTAASGSSTMRRGSSSTTSSSLDEAIERGQKALEFAICEQKKGEQGLDRLSSASLLPGDASVRTDASSPAPASPRALAARAKVAAAAAYVTGVPASMSEVGSLWRSLRREAAMDRAAPHAALLREPSDIAHRYSGGRGPLTVRAKYKGSSVPVSTTVTRSLGDWDASRGLTPQPEVASFTVGPGQHERVLIASDGLWAFVSHAEAAAVVRKASSASDASAQLAEKAEMRSWRRKGKLFDDVTVVCVDLDGSAGGAEATKPKRAKGGEGADSCCAIS